LDHPHLRPGILPAHRHRRVPVAPADGPSRSCRDLLTRGLWLLFLEITVLRCLGFQFNFDYQVTLLNVLWTLGWSMMALAALTRLPPAVVTGVGLVMIARSQPARRRAVRPPLWVVLHTPGFLHQSAPCRLLVTR
jgi:uncharacterized membrane protein